MNMKQTQMTTEIEPQDIPELELGDAIAIEENDTESAIQEGDSLSQEDIEDLLDHLEEPNAEDEKEIEELVKQLEASDSEVLSRSTVISDSETVEVAEDAKRGGPSRMVIETYRAVNSVRRRHGVPPLRLDNRLVAAAREHSMDMARYKRMSHTGSKGSSPSDRARRKGYPSGAGENVAAGQPSVRAVMKSWMNSPGHRRNILSRKYKAFGSGSCKSGIWYWTQMFGLR